VAEGALRHTLYCEPQRGAGHDEVVVDGDDGVRGELPDGPDPAVEAVPLVGHEPHIAAAPGGADDALAKPPLD
jgi:hypothetical protein